MAGPDSGVKYNVRNEHRLDSLGCVPYDETLRTIFEANHNPASWGGLSTTPWYLARMERK